MKCEFMHHPCTQNTAFSGSDYAIQVMFVYSENSIKLIFC